MSDTTNVQSVKLLLKNKVGVLTWLALFVDIDGVGFVGTQLTIGFIEYHLVHFLVSKPLVILKVLSVSAYSLLLESYFCLY